MIVSLHFYRIIYKINYNCSKKKPVGKFKCECCGFTYVRCGPDTCEEDKCKIGKVITIGEKCKSEIERLWSMNLSIRNISRQLKVGQKTIKKYI
ncbi:TnsD family Tn7-like transposition protein [Clostridium butyricum]